MTLDEFVTLWNGKQLEVAGSAEAKYQCVDLANGYIRDILRFPIIEWTNAKDFPTRAGDRYEYIKNSPEGAPVEGDLVVWNGKVGNGNGHIAVCIENGTPSRFKSFDQNWSKPLYCTIETHTYTNSTGAVIVDGWLRPKQLVSSDTIPVLKIDFERLVTKSTKYDEFVVAGFETVKDATSQIVALTSQYSDSQRQLEREAAIRLDLLEKIKKLESTIGYKYNEADILLTVAGLRLIRNVKD